MSLTAVPGQTTGYNLLNRHLEKKQLFFRPSLERPRLEAETQKRRILMKFLRTGHISYGVRPFPGIGWSETKGQFLGYKITLRVAKNKFDL